MTQWFAIVCLISQVSSQNLTIEDAIKIAGENAFGVRIAEAQRAKAARFESQAKGAFGPNISTSATLSRFESSLDGSRDTKSASLNLVQPIDISGLSRKALQATEFNRKAAEAGLGVANNNLKLNVRTAFYNVLLSAELVNVQIEALKATNERYEKAKIRKQEETISQFDLLRFENEVRKAEQALTQARGNLEQAKHGLNSALSRSIETEFDAEPVTSLPTIPEDPAGLVSTAILNRPEIKQSEFTIVSLTRTADVQSASIKPQLNIQANHTRNFNPGVQQADHSSTAGVFLTVPLFDSGITQSKVEAAKFDVDIAKIGLEQLILGIALEVRDAYSRAGTARANYLTAEESAKLARQTLKLAEIRYDEGVGILLDVIQSQADLTAALGAVQTTKYQFMQAYSALLRALGMDDIQIKQ